MRPPAGACAPRPAGCPGSRPRPGRRSAPAGSRGRRPATPGCVRATRPSPLRSTRSPRSRRRPGEVVGQPAPRPASRQLQQHRDAGLHVRGAAAVQHVAVHAGRHVVGDRHGVQVPGQQHPARPAERGPGEHRVAVAVHLRPADGPQRRLDRVGERALVAGDRLDVDQRGGQRRAVRGQVERHRATVTTPADLGRVNLVGGREALTQPRSRGAAGGGGRGRRVRLRGERERLGRRPGHRHRRRPGARRLVPAPALGAGAPRDATPPPAFDGAGRRGRAPRHRAGSRCRCGSSDLAAPPADTADAYLRLHLLAHRLVRPHGLNLDGIFGLLPNVAWTSAGPCPPEDVEETGCGCSIDRAGSRSTGWTSSPG